MAEREKSPPPAEVAEQPLELILARNLVSLISLATVLIDVEGAIVFFNDAAAEIFGGLFEETGATHWRGGGPRSAPSTRKGGNFRRASFR